VALQVITLVSYERTSQDVSVQAQESRLCNAMVVDSIRYYVYSLSSALIDARWLKLDTMYSTYAPSVASIK
jgi:hypothetical protein